MQTQEAADRPPPGREPRGAATEAWRRGARVPGGLAWREAPSVLALRHPDGCHVRSAVSCRSHSCRRFRDEEAKAQSGYLPDTPPGWDRNQTAGASTCLAVGGGQRLGPALAPRAATRTRGRSLWPVGLPPGVCGGWVPRKTPRGPLGS